MKRITAVVLVLLLVLALVACGQPENPAPTSNDPTQVTESNEKLGFYTDRWFLYGNLGQESLTVHENGAWEFRNVEDADGNGGRIVCEGTSSLDDHDSLILTEKDGQEVGFAAMDQNILTLWLNTDFEWLLESYLVDGDLTFNREKDSIRIEDQSAVYDGYWMYANGYVLHIEDDMWYLYDDGGVMTQSGPVELDDEEDAAWLMSESGSSGSGKIFFNEDGELTDMGTALYKLDEFPYDDSEG